MNAWDAYRVRAAELRASAKKETRRDLAEEFEDLARAYLLLAEMAERNGQLDLTYEAPVKMGEDDKHA
jgi:NTP pyrophosphatase (non-canonical NTP hydrolase)